MLNRPSPDTLHQTEANSGVATRPSPANAIKEAGFDSFLHKKSEETTEEMLGDESNYRIKQVSGSSLAAGISKSSDGKLVIDWNKGEISFADGARYRVQIGDLGGTGQHGLRIVDNLGNIRFESSDQQEIFNVWSNEGVLRVSFGEFSNGATGVRAYAPNGTLSLEISDDQVYLLMPNNDGITPGTELYRPVSFEHTFTGSATYLDNTGTEFKFNADDFPGFNFAYEACMAVEQAGRTAYSRIYNITDGLEVEGSVITSTAVGITAQAPAPVRSGGITFPSGEKTYIIQRKQSPVGDGGDNMHMYLATLVFDKQ